ncbi:MAG: hypothetical protein ACYTFK_06935 [Planctomycetota bacterium]|jgi:hypothetical protein
MIRQKKVAILRLKIIAVSVLTGLVIGLAVALASNDKYALILGSFIPAVGNLVAAICFIFIPKQQGQISHDERDELIKKRALHISYGVMLSVLIIGLTAPVFMTSNGMIPSYYLNVLLITILSVTIVTESVAVLFQYGRREGEKS